MKMLSPALLVRACIATVFLGTAATTQRRSSLTRSITARLPSLVALVGIVLNALLLFIFITNFLAARANALEELSR